MATVEAFARDHLPIVGGAPDDDAAEEEFGGWAAAYTAFADAVTFGDAFVSFAEFERRMKAAGWEARRNFIGFDNGDELLWTLVVPPNEQRTYR
jgi:hypothetical protein